MRILIVADPIESFKTYKDSTYAIMVAAAARGHSLAFCEQGQLWLEDGHAWADASDLALSGPQLGEAGGRGSAPATTRTAGGSAARRAPSASPRSTRC